MTIFPSRALTKMAGPKSPRVTRFRVNFTAVLAASFITGQVQFQGSPVANVQVNANSQDGNNYSVQAVTDDNGNFSLLVANDTWYVSVNCQGGDNSLDGALGHGNYQCPCGYNVTVLNANVTTNFVVQGGGAGEIFGYVTNAAGNPIIGVTVSGTDCNGDYSSSVTGGSGNYSMNVPNGVWDVSVDCGFLSSQGYQCVNSANVTVSDNNAEQNFTVQGNGSGGGALQITTQSLPDGFAGSFYSQQLSAAGGAPPYAWALALGSQSLPSALTLSTNGLLSGVLETSGTNSFILSLTDSSFVERERHVHPRHQSGPQTGFTGQIRQPLPVSGQRRRGPELYVAKVHQFEFPQLDILFMTNSAASSFLFSDPNATNSQRFYRVVVGP